MIHRFWHRVHLSGYSEYANLLIDMLPCRLIPGPAIRKVFMIFLLFVMSGLSHHFASLQLKNPRCTGYADIQFFCMNGIAVILESAILQVGSPRKASRDRSNHGGEIRAPRRLPLALVRYVGHLWVIGFFVWTTPKLYYSRVYCTAINQ